jgi:hypothetical protein
MRLEDRIKRIENGFSLIVSMFHDINDDMIEFDYRLSELEYRIDRKTIIKKAIK